MNQNTNDASTIQALSQELKALKSQCVEACHIIENAPPECITSENAHQKTLSYVEGVRTAIQNSETALPTDANLLTSQFLKDMEDRTRQVEELAAFTKGSIKDVDAEIKRLNNQIAIAEKAISQPPTGKKQVTQEHITRARERFKQMKTALISLIDSLFPDKSEGMQEFLGTLMSERLNESSGGYIQMTEENYALVELLKGTNIITTNPYNDMEVKLAY